LSFYLDTSVLVAYYCPEPLSERVEEFIITHDRPGISFLTDVEFCSALSRKIREGGLNQRDGGRILAKFYTHQDNHLYRNLAVESHHFRLARDWMALFNTSLKTLDAIHLAVASSQGLIFVTADQSLTKSAKALGLEVLLL
jgi:uncharacterized protein